jgi:bacillithiol system protein YtxJ
MEPFRKTSHLSEIIEASQKEPVVIFKYSSECGSSSRLKSAFEKCVEEKKEMLPTYLVTVQTQPTLSKNIAEMFEIKHESPQIIILSKGKVIHTAHHNDIKIEDFQIK